MCHSSATWRAAVPYGSSSPRSCSAANSSDILTANIRLRSPVRAGKRPPELLLTIIRKAKRLSPRRAAATNFLRHSECNACCSMWSASSAPVGLECWRGRPARFCPARGVPCTTSRTESPGSPRNARARNVSHSGGISSADASAFNSGSTLPNNKPSTAACHSGPSNESGSGGATLRSSQPSGFSESPSPMPNSIINRRLSLDAVKSGPPPRQWKDSIRAEIVTGQRRSNPRGDGVRRQHQRPIRNVGITCSNARERVAEQTCNR